MQDWSLEEKFGSSTVRGGIIVSVILLLIGGGLLVGPSFVFETTEETRFESVNSPQLVVDNGTNISFEGDTRAKVVQEIGVSQNGEFNSVYLTGIVRYDADSERVLIDNAPNIANGSNPKYVGQRVVTRTYISRNETTGKFDKYTKFRIYNSMNNSWVALDNRQDACKVNQTTTIEKESGVIYQDRLPYSSGDIALEGGSMLVETLVSEGNNKKVITIKEGRFQPKLSQGGFIHITESSGRAVAVEQSVSDGESVYEIQDSNITVTGQFYNGFRHFPVTKIWQGSEEFRINHSVSVDHSDTVTVEEPQWVQEYKSSCS